MDINRNQMGVGGDSQDMCAKLSTFVFSYQIFTLFEVKDIFLIDFHTNACRYMFYTNIQQC